MQQRNTIEKFLDKLQDFAYLETFVLVIAYLVVGATIDSQDVCMLHSQISYMLILLSVITLFHGFENGMFALGLLAIAIWYFYPLFEYKEFLVALMMTMIFSEFHYFWTKKIRQAEINSNYRKLKLDELSKSFYSLKISHDQLEKNYVVKPMSIRNSIAEIIKENEAVDRNENLDINERTKEYYKKFMILLEKSFSVNKSLVIYKSAQDSSILSAENALQSCSSTCDVKKLEDIFDNYLVDKAISRKQAVFISDEKGNPDLHSTNETKFIAAIPSVHDDEVISVLIIEMMPFMAFNRENLTSIAILLEYLSFSVVKEDKVDLSDEFDTILDGDFRYECIRLKRLYDKYNVESTLLVMKLDNELQAHKLNNTVSKILRSLEFTTTQKYGKNHYIINLFPLHDKSSAVGYINRLMSLLGDERDKKFEHLSFNMQESKILSKYLKEDYSE